MLAWGAHIERLVCLEIYYSPCRFSLTSMPLFSRLIPIMSEMKLEKCRPGNTNIRAFRSGISCQIFECKVCGKKTVYDDWVFYDVKPWFGAHICRGQYSEVITYNWPRRIGPWRDPLPSSQRRKDAIRCLIAIFAIHIIYFILWLAEEIAWLLY